MRVPRRPVILLTALSLGGVGAVGVAGCGGGSSKTAATGAGQTGTVPLARAPEPTTPVPHPTTPNTTEQPPATQTAPSSTSTSPETAPGGGDEQPIRVPAMFTINGGELSPLTITVPPFLAVQVTVTSADGRAHRVVLRTPQQRTLAVAPGSRASVRIPGLRAGRYEVEVDGKPAGAIVSGGDVGP